MTHASPTLEIGELFGFPPVTGGEIAAAEMFLDRPRTS